MTLNDVCNKNIMKTQVTLAFQSAFSVSAEKGRKFIWLSNITGLTISANMNKMRMSKRMSKNYRYFAQ